MIGEIVYIKTLIKEWLIEEGIYEDIKTFRTYVFVMGQAIVLNKKNKFKGFTYEISCWVERTSYKPNNHLITLTNRTDKFNFHRKEFKVPSNTMKITDICNFIIRFFKEEFDVVKTY